VGECAQERGVDCTHVVNEFANVRKNCLWVVNSRETIRVANKSRVSCG